LIYVNSAIQAEFSLMLLNRPTALIADCDIARIETLNAKSRSTFCARKARANDFFSTPIAYRINAAWLLTSKN